MNEVSPEARLICLRMRNCSIVRSRLECVNVDPVITFLVALLRANCETTGV